MRAHALVSACVQACTWIRVSLRAFTRINASTVSRAGLIKTQNVFARKKSLNSNALWVQKLSGCTTHTVVILMDVLHNNPSFPPFLPPFFPSSLYPSLSPPLPPLPPSLHSSTPLSVHPFLPLPHPSIPPNLPPHFTLGVSLLVFSSEGAVEIWYHRALHVSTAVTTQHLTQIRTVYTGLYPPPLRLALAPPLCDL